MNTTKKCTYCLEEKVLTEFNTRKESKDGLYPTCKACMKFKKIEPTLKELKTIYHNKLHLNKPYCITINPPIIKLQDGLYFNEDNFKIEYCYIPLNELIRVN